MVAKRSALTDVNGAEMTDRVRFQQGTIPRVVDHQTPEHVLVLPQPGAVSPQEARNDSQTMQENLSRTCAHRLLQAPRDPVRPADIKGIFSSWAIDHVNPRNSACIQLFCIAGNVRSGACFSLSSNTSMAFSSLVFKRGLPLGALAIPQGPESLPTSITGNRRRSQHDSESVAYGEGTRLDPKNRLP